MSDFDGRVVAITGATGVLGRTAAAAFAADGARLGLFGTDGGRIAAVAQELGLANDQWAAGSGDLRDAEQSASAVAAATERLGPIDTLLHLVGGWTGGTPVTEVEPAVLDDMLGQHVWSTFHIVRGVLPGMIERGFGRIVAVTATVTANPGPRQASYVAAKSAQEAMLRSVAREVAGTGVTVNLIAVKAIDKEGVRDREPSPKTAGWTTPDEIVATMRWLGSTDAARVNGARIPLDGG